MNTNKQTERNGWFIIRLAGLTISLYAIYQLIGIAFIAYSIQEKLEHMKEIGIQFNLENEFRPLVIPVLLYISYLVFGIYCLRGGGFLHRLLCYRPHEVKDDLSCSEREHVTHYKASSSEAISGSGDGQRELYFKFLRDHPEMDNLQSKEKHVAFRSWMEQQEV
jgi:hypothetical protein